MKKNNAIDLYKLLAADLEKKWRGIDECNEIENVLFHKMQMMGICPEFLPILQLDEIADEICDLNLNKKLIGEFSAAMIVDKIIDLLGFFREQYPDESIGYLLLKILGEEFDAKSKKNTSDL